jgi:hypothetical protein
MCSKNGKYNNGWFVGYVITNHDKYYFATHLSDGKPSGKNAELINHPLLYFPFTIPVPVFPYSSYFSFFLINNEEDN